MTYVDLSDLSFECFKSVFIVTDQSFALLSADIRLLESLFRGCVLTFKSRVILLKVVKLPSQSFRFLGDLLDLLKEVVELLLFL